MSKLIPILLWGLTMSSSISANGWGTRPDTWVATDALGRTVCTADKVGPPREGKFVGVFYFLWLGEHAGNGPYDTAKILAQDPEAMRKPDSPLWGPRGSFHHWGEPLFGYYRTDDQWVLRKHAQMLSDAGVDVVIFDVTNQFTYAKEYLALCEAWSQVRKEGGRTPQIAFLTPFWDPTRVVNKLHADLYGKGLYKDLWFQWKGKPLIMADPAKVAPELKDFFTYRRPQPSYFEGPTGPEQWGWLEKYPQHIFHNAKNEPEQMVVGVGQNTEGTRCCAFSEANTLGRSWHDGKKDERPGAVNLGLNVAEQWERALKVDPEFIFITGWNEWIAMRLDSFGDYKEPVMFVDQYTEEYSRDIEPMKGGYGDSYYCQMVDYIRRFKGANKGFAAAGPSKISIDGDFSKWAKAKPEYRDDIGDTAHRDHAGYGKAGQYINNTGRNDITLCKVAYDSKNVHFYVKTGEPITPHTDANWMMLLIDVDSNPSTGWEGFNYLVNQTVRDSSVTMLKQWGPNDKAWNNVGPTRYRVKGCEMEVTVPRSIFADGELAFNFKWVDNALKTNDIMELYTDGDTAPNGRFAYRFVGQE